MVQVDGKWKVLDITEKRRARFWLLGYLVTVKNEKGETVMVKVPTTVNRWPDFNESVSFFVRRALANLKKDQEPKPVLPQKRDYRKVVGMGIEYDPIISDWLADKR